MQFQQQTRYLLFPPFLQHLGATAAAGWDQDSTDLFAEAWKARAKCLSKKGNKRHATSGVLVKAIRLNGHLDSLLAAWEKHASDAAALRVVMLIRDPRGLVTSRLRNGWYTVMIDAPCVSSNVSVANSLWPQGASSNTWNQINQLGGDNGGVWQANKESRFFVAQSSFFLIHRS